jgi:hypothetical protein
MPDPATIAASAAELEKLLAKLGASDSASGSQIAEILKEVVQITMSRGSSPTEIMKAYGDFLERGVKVTQTSRSKFVSFFIGSKEEVRKSLI